MEDFVHGLTILLAGKNSYQVEIEHKPGIGLRLAHRVLRKHMTGLWGKENRQPKRQRTPARDRDLAAGALQDADARSGATDRACVLECACPLGSLPAFRHTEVAQVGNLRYVPRVQDTCKVQCPLALCTLMEQLRTVSCHSGGCGRSKGVRRRSKRAFDRSKQAFDQSIGDLIFQKLCHVRASACLMSGQIRVRAGGGRSRSSRDSCRRTASRRRLCRAAR